MACAGINEPRKWICDGVDASIFGGSVNGKDLLRSGLYITLMKGDVTVEHRNFRRWRYGGLQIIQEDEEGFFLGVED